MSTLVTTLARFCDQFCGSGEIRAARDSLLPTLLSNTMLPVSSWRNNITIPNEEGTDVHNENWRSTHSSSWLRETDATQIDLECMLSGVPSRSSRGSD